MDKEQLEKIADALGAIGAGLSKMSAGFLDLASAARAAALKPEEKPQSLTEKFKAEFEAARPKGKPAQLDLFDFRTPDYGAKPRAPERGFENEVNPAHVAAGAIGGHATAGVKRAVSPDRRKPGTVNVDRMDVQAKREYWRWAGDRKAARRAGCRVLGWDEWKTLKRGLTNPGNAV